MSNRVHRPKKRKRSSFTGNKVQLIRGGREYFDLVVDLVNKARHSVHLQTYIFENDATGSLVAEALANAAERNVEVFLLLDGYASQGLPDAFIEGLEASGVHFRYFEPLFKSRNFYFGRRLHSKVLVVDASYAVVGGVNITDRYNDMPGQPAWLDFALFAEGPVAVEACELCRSVWSGTLRRIKSADCEPHSGFHFDENEASLVRLRRNDWVNNRLQISNSYLEMFRTATSHITILSSYALPGNVFRKNLERAIKRGVKVRMIISGESDVKVVKAAEKYWYAWLVRNNIEIFEYTKNVLHGKLAVCDSEWMTIGSYNVNDLSAYVSIELNFDVRDPNFVKKVDETLQQIIDTDCVKISPDSIAQTNTFKRLVRWLSYTLIRITFSLTTFYYRKQK
ncbi:MAG: phospholipase [Chitinophagaceae bacterium]|nr:phospholipase [Chitinophagaceae bacterium]